MNKVSCQVYYNDEIIGDIIIRNIGNGVYADFDTLYDMNYVLDKMGGYALNWFQMCTHDDNPPYDIEGKQVTVPYIDPYPGGFALEKDKNFMYWNDGKPWYWDVSSIKTFRGFNGSYDITCTLPSNMTDNSLSFEDQPCLKKNSLLKFTTCLVCLDYEEELLHTLFGFSWSIKKDKDGDVTVEIKIN